MIATRYESLPDDRIRDYLLSQCDHVEGLVGLVIEILKVEASLHENDGDTTGTFVAVINEELTKAGVPAATRLGAHQGLYDFARQAHEVPRVG